MNHTNANSIQSDENKPTKKSLTALENFIGIDLDANFNLLTGKPYLGAEILTGFDNYKYSAVDTSPYSVYVVNPIWNYLVKFLPLWLAPNLITLVGVLLSVSTFIILSYYDYDFKTANINNSIQPIPSWVWFYCGIAHFIGYNLDGLDGKQARRTGSSSPVGELMDHGLDSTASFYIVLCSISAIGIEQYGLSEYKIFAMVVVGIYAFHISHWEKYITGVLYLPWLFDFTHQGISLVYLLTGILGVNTWQANLLEWGDWKLSLAMTYLIVVTVSTVLSSPICVYNAIKSYENKTHQTRSLYDVTVPWIPFCILVVGFYMWAWLSPNAILIKNPRCFLFTLGIVFSNMNMAKTRFRVYNSLILLTYAAIVLSLLVPAYESLILYAFCVIALLTHVHFGYSVIRQLCSHFNISCFTIKPKSRSENSH